MTPGIWGVIALGCDGNNQLFQLTLAIIEGDNIDSCGWFLTCIRNRVTQRMRLCVISNRHPSIMVTMTDVYLCWIEPYACHRIYMRYLFNNFMNRFKDEILKNFMCIVALTTEVGKVNKQMDTIERISLEAQ